MSEQEWLESDVTRTMLTHLLTGQPSKRKVRLFAVACCRGVWDSIPAGEFRGLVEVLEHFLERQATWRDVVARRKRAEQSYGPYYNDWVAGRSTAAPFAWATIQAAGQTLENVRQTVECTKRLPLAKHPVRTWTAPEQAALVRDIFPNPYRPVTSAKHWRASTVLDLAR